MIRPDGVPGGHAHCASSSDRDRAAALAGSLPSAEEVEQLAEVFRLLGDRGRVALLVTLLEGGEVCVHDLAAVTGQSESGVSHALRLLRAHRVVAVRRAGRQAFYRLADGHVRMLLDVALTHLGHAPALHRASPTGATLTRATPAQATTSEKDAS